MKITQSKPKIGYFGLLFHKEVNNPYGSYSFGNTAIVEGAFQQAGMHSVMLDHKLFEINNYVNNYDAIFAFGEYMNIAKSRTEGLQKIAVNYIKSEQEGFIQAIEKNKLFVGAGLAMQHIMMFSFGCNLTDDNSFKNNNHVQYLEEYPIIIRDKHSIYADIAKDQKKWDHENNIGNLKVNHLNNQGITSENFDLLQEEIFKFFNGKPPFKVVKTAESLNNMVESIEFRDLDNNIMAILTRSNHEYTRQAKQTSDNENIKLLINETDAEKTANNFFIKMRNLIHKPKKIAEEAKIGIKQFIEYNSKRGLGINSVGYKSAYYNNEILDNYSPYDIHKVKYPIM